MKKVLLITLALGLMTVHGAYASCGKDAKTKEEPQAHSAKLVISEDQLNNPQEFLAWLKENPGYMTAWVTELYNGVSQPLIRRLLIVEQLNRNGKWDETIQFLLSKKTLKELLQGITPESSKNIKALLIHWAVRRININKKYDSIDLLLTQGMGAQEMLENIIKNDKLYSLIPDRYKAIKEKLEEIIALEHAGTEINPYTFEQIGEVMKPSNPRILAIKNAIEDENLDVLAQALGMRILFGEVDKELLELRDQTGYTPFLYAAYLGKRKAMRMLIEVGADVNAQTKDGAKATDFGDYAKLIDEARLYREGVLAKQKKDLEEQLKRDSETLFQAIENNLPDQITMFTAPAIINMKNDKGNTPLIEAASLGKIAMVKALLDQSADTSLTNSNRNTALQSAIIENHFDIANLLIVKMDKKALQNKNEQGFTAYDLAIQKEHLNKDNAQFMMLVETMKVMMQ